MLRLGRVCSLLLLASVLHAASPRGISEARAGPGDGITPVIRRNSRLSPVLLGAATTRRGATPGPGTSRTTNAPTSPPSPRRCRRSSRTSCRRSSSGRSSISTCTPASTPSRRRKSQRRPPKTIDTMWLRGREGRGSSTRPSARPSRSSRNHQPSVAEAHSPPRRRAPA